MVATAAVGRRTERPHDHPHASRARFPRILQPVRVVVHEHRARHAGPLDAGVRVGRHATLALVVDERALHRLHHATLADGRRDRGGRGLQRGQVRHDREGERRPGHVAAPGGSRLEAERRPEAPRHGGRGQVHAVTVAAGLHVAAEPEPAEQRAPRGATVGVGGESGVLIAGGLTEGGDQSLEPHVGIEPHAVGLHGRLEPRAARVHVHAIVELGHALEIERREAGDRPHEGVEEPLRAAPRRRDDRALDGLVERRVAGGEAEVQRRLEAHRAANPAVADGLALQRERVAHEAGHHAVWVDQVRQAVA